MAVADKVKAMISLKGKKHKDFADFLGVSHQALRNKFVRGSFTAEDLIKLSMFLDAELVFKIADNQHIILDENDLR